MLTSESSVALQVFRLFVWAGQLMERLPPVNLRCHGGSGRFAGSSLQQSQYKPHQIPHEVPQEQEVPQNLEVGGVFSSLELVQPGLCALCDPGY